MKLRIFLQGNKHICICCKILISRICNKQKLHRVGDQNEEILLPQEVTEFKKEADVSLLAGLSQMKATPCVTTASSQLPLPSVCQFLSPCQVVACRGCGSQATASSWPQIKLILAGGNIWLYLFQVNNIIKIYTCVVFTWMKICFIYYFDFLFLSSNAITWILFYSPERL